MSNRTERAVGRKLLSNSGSKGAKAHKGAASATNATQKNRAGSFPQRNASTSAVEQIAAAEHENENHDAQLVSICKQLGFDRRTRTELVNTYNELNASFALEGDPLGWFAAVVYIAVKRASLNGESPPFSVTRLLQIAKITLSELFRKVRKTCELSRADEAVRGAVDRAESVFAVSSVLFRRFDQLMRAVFAVRGPTSTSAHLALLRGDGPESESDLEEHKATTATGELIYAFGWLLFLFARTQFELVADDLVSSFMLLVCCVDATFRNTLQLADESCFNENFLTQFFTPAQRAALFESRDAPTQVDDLELIAFACSRFAFGAHELDVRTVRCHFFDALLRAALINVDGRGAFLQGDADSLGQLLCPANLQHNFCALSAYCDEHVLRACDVDERVFINERPPDAVNESPCGTPYRDLLGLPVAAYEPPRLASPPPPAPAPDDTLGAACDAHQQAFAALRSVILIGGLRDAAQRVQTRFPARADALERRVRTFTTTFLAWSQPQHDAPAPVSVDCARFIVQVATGVYWNVLESLLIEEEEQFRATARRRHEALARAGRKRPAARGRPKERLRDPEGRAEPHQHSAVHLNAVARRRARERVELRLRRLLNDLIAVDEMHRGVFVIALDLVLFLYGLASSRRERLCAAQRTTPEAQKESDEAESDVRDADRERLETLLALFGASAFGVSKLLVCVARCGCVASLPRAATTHLARVDELLVEELVLRDPSPFWRALHAYERALRDSDEPSASAPAPASAAPAPAPEVQETQPTRTFELPGPDELCVVDPVRAHARPHTLTGNVSVSLGGSGTRRRRTLAAPSLGVLTSSSCFRADDEPNAQRLASLAGVYLSPLNRLVSLRERERALERSRRGEGLTSSAKRRLFAADDRPNPADGDCDGDAKRISRSLFAEADVARSPSSRSPGATPHHGSPARPGTNVPRPPFGSPQRTLSASPVRSVPLGMPLRGTSNPSQPVPVPAPGGSPLAVLSPRRVPAGQRISRVAAPPRLVDPSTAPTIRVQNSSAALAALRPAPRYPYAPNANVFETPPQVPFALPAGSPSKSAAEGDQSRMSSHTPTKPTPAITVTSPITHASAQVNTTTSARPGTSIVCSSTSPAAAESEAAPTAPQQQPTSATTTKLGPSTNGNATVSATTTQQPSAPRNTVNAMCASQSVSIIVASSTVAVARPSASRIVLAPSTTSTVVCSSAAAATSTSVTAAATTAATTSTTSVVKVGARFVPRGSPLSVVRAPAPPRGTTPAPATTTTISASQSQGQTQPQTTRMPVVSVTSVRMPAASRNLFAISHRYPRPTLGLGHSASQGRPSPTGAPTPKTTASTSSAPVTTTMTAASSPPKSSNTTDTEDVELLATGNASNSGEAQQNGEARKRPVEAVDGGGVMKRRRTDEEPRRRRPPCGASLRQFVRRMYLLASDRLRRLCAMLGTPDELIAQIWTVFVHCVRDVALLRAILRGRHLDQALLCCVYATWYARLQRERLAARRTQLGSATSASGPGASPSDTSDPVIDSLFTQRIIREYRKMPHARSETYRRVRLLRIGTTSDDDTNSDSDTADSAYEYGDLIVFYNNLFQPLVNSFVLQLVTQSTGKLTGEQLVALNVAPPSTTRAESPSGPDTDRLVSVSMLVRGLLSPLPALRYTASLQPAALLPTRVSPRFYASFKLPAPPSAAPGGALSLSVPAKSVGARSVAAAAALEASGSPAKLLLHRLKKRHDKPKQHDWTILLRSLRRQYPSTDRQQRLFYVTDVSPLRELHTINVALRHAAPNTRPLSFLVTPNPSADRSDPPSNSNPGSEAQTERPVSNLDRLVEAAFSVSRADSIADLPCKSEPTPESVADKTDVLRRNDETSVKTEPMDESERPLAPATTVATATAATTTTTAAAPVPVQAEQPAEPRRGRPPKHVEAAAQPSGSRSEKPGALRPATRASVNKARPSK